jgi:hypothetical protein
VGQSPAEQQRAGISKRPPDRINVQKLIQEGHGLVAERPGVESHTCEAHQLLPQPLLDRRASTPHRRVGPYHICGVARRRGADASFERCP